MHTHSLCLSRVQLMSTRPFKALFLCQLAHNLGEFHIFGPWAPTYYNQVSHDTAGEPHSTYRERKRARARVCLRESDRGTLCSLMTSVHLQVLGVPMEAVGSYMQWPVISAIGIKLCIGIWESKLLSLGWPQR